MQQYIGIDTDFLSRIALDMYGPLNGLEQREQAFYPHPSLLLFVDRLQHTRRHNIGLEIT